MTSSCGSPSWSTYEKHAAVGDDARRASRERPVDRAVGGEHAGEVELRDRLDDPRAADPGHARAREAGLVRPRVGADHAEPRLERLRIDPDALDRARCRALAEGDLRALESGPGRARGREQPFAVAEHDLGVRADVDDEVHLVAEMRGLGEDHPRGVRADVTRDAGEDVHAGAAVDRAARDRDAGRRSDVLDRRARTARRRARSGRARAGGGA